MSNAIHCGPARIRAIRSTVAVTAGLMVAGGVWAAPAYATCSPGARPCINNVFMSDPTTLEFTWTDSAASYQVRYHDTSDPVFLGSVPFNYFATEANRWDIMNVEPGKSYALGVQTCTSISSLYGTDTSCTEWDEKTFTVPLSDSPIRALPKHPIGDQTPPYLDKRIDLPELTAAASAATVAADVDVYNAKNEPDGAGEIIGILRQGAGVKLVGDCVPEAWCEVSGDAVPREQGWVWGHLNLP